MNPLDIVYGAEVCKPLLQLFCEAFVRIIELSNTAKDTIFADLLENDKLAGQLYTYLNTERHYEINSSPYYIRRGLLLLDILSEHKIIELCKSIDSRGIYICCKIFRLDFTSGVLSVTGEIDSFSANYVEILIREDILRIKAFIQRL